MGILQLPMTPCAAIQLGIEGIHLASLCRRPRSLLSAPGAGLALGPDRSWKYSPLLCVSWRWGYRQNGPVWSQSGQSRPLPALSRHDSLGPLGRSPYHFWWICLQRPRGWWLFANGSVRHKHSLIISPDNVVSFVIVIGKMENFITVCSGIEHLSEAAAFVAPPDLGDLHGGSIFQFHIHKTLFLKKLKPQLRG